MIKSIVPQSKLGTPFQSPSWRYQALLQPERFGFSWLCSRKTVDCSHLSRLIPKGIRPASCYSVPLYVQQLSSTLPVHLQEVLMKVWNKRYFKTQRKKLTFDTSTSQNIPISWNLEKVKLLNDDFLRSMVHHVYNYKYDPYIDAAIIFYLNENNAINVKWMNYGFFAGMTDKEQAIKWKKPLKFIQALRLIFFDYSHWPADRVVQFSLIRQMVTNKELDEPDYHCFRRIYDLGKVGLQSIIGYHKLNPDEAKQVEQYLGSSAVDNLLNLNYTITNVKDAVNYNRAISEFAGVKLKKMETDQRSEILRLSAARLAKEMGMQDQTNMFDEDSELMQLITKKMEQHALENPRGEFPTFIDVKSEKIEVEKPA